MKILFIINESPYGGERSYNGLRLAISLARSAEEPEIMVFLMADGVYCAKANQETPVGYYNIERMIKSLIQRGSVLLCGVCMDARGLKDEDLVSGCRRSSLDELTDLTIKADKVITF